MMAPRGKTRMVLVLVWTLALTVAPKGRDGPKAEPLVVLEMIVSVSYSLPLFSLTYCC